MYKRQILFRNRPNTTLPSCHRIVGRFAPSGHHSITARVLLHSNYHTGRCRVHDTELFSPEAPHLVSVGTEPNHLHGIVGSRSPQIWRERRQVGPFSYGALTHPFCFIRTEDSRSDYKGLPIRNSVDGAELWTSNATLFTDMLDPP